MYSRGSIVLVNLNPQRNNEAGKVRPCVVVSALEVNEILELVTVVPCTTNLLGEGLFRVVLQKREKLDKQCEAMIEQIRGVSKSRIIEFLGEIDEKESMKIDQGIKALLNL